MNKNPGIKHILSDLMSDIQFETDRIGIHCRIHARIKDTDSLKEKIARKEKEKRGYYTPTGKKIQDIIGIRITTYFLEDVKLLWDIFEQKYQKVDEANDIITHENLDVFKPVHKNLVCRMDDAHTQYLTEVLASGKDYIFSLIDNTFEIQFRTTLSEGWHEIDHVLRYKCKADWDDFVEESRMLNGIYATLETSDKALKALFEDLAYQHYKRQNWEAMLRTKFRLKFTKDPLSSDICSLLNEKNDLAKQFFRIEREDFLEKIAFTKLHIPITYNNLIYLLNYTTVKDSAVENLQPDILKADFEAYLGKGVSV